MNYCQDKELLLIKLSRQVPSAEEEPEDQCKCNKYRDKNSAAVKHIAKEAGHLHAVLLSDTLDHKVRSVADVCTRSHKYGTERNRYKQFPRNAHNTCNIARNRFGGWGVCSLWPDCLCGHITADNTRDNLGSSILLWFLFCD